jgi:hypothetical protein
MSAIRSLTGVKRTSLGKPNSVENDPTATSTVRENLERLRFECGIEIGDPVDADELGVKQLHKLFSENSQAQEQVGRFRQKNE